MSFYQRSWKSPSVPKWNKVVCNEYEFLRGKQALNVNPEGFARWSRCRGESGSADNHLDEGDAHLFQFSEFAEGHFTAVCTQGDAWHVCCQLLVEGDSCLN